MWYPPAETKIPFTAILSSFFPQKTTFEKVLCDYLNIENCLLGNSGRSLLYLLLKDLYNRERAKRNVVIIPGYTCYSVAASVVKAGLKVGVYDLDCKTLHPNLQSLNSAISPKTLAIIHQHLFGIPTPIKDVKKIAEEKGVYLIEDAAQALGGRLNSQMLGTIGDFGLYSFGRGKPLPGGDGGALISIRDDILKSIKCNKQKMEYSKLSATALSQIISKPQFYGIAERLPLGLGETIFEPNFRTASMSLAMRRLLIKSLPTLRKLNIHRKHISNIYENNIESNYMIPVPKGAPVSYTRYPLMMKNNDLSKDLYKMGVRRMYPKAVTDEIKIQPYLDNKYQANSGSKSIARRLVTLPTNTGINAILAKKIVNEIKKQ